MSKTHVTIIYIRLPQTSNIPPTDPLFWTIVVRFVMMVHTHKTRGCAGHGEATGGVLHVLTCISYGRRSTPSNQYGRSWSLPVPHVFCMGAPYISPETGRLHVLPYLILGVPRRPYKIPRCRSRSGFSPGSLPMKYM